MPGRARCFAAFAIGLFGAPFCAVSGALAAGLTARRASRGVGRTAAAIWKRSFGAGLLGAVLGAFVAVLVLGVVWG